MACQANTVTMDTQVVGVSDRLLMLFTAVITSFVFITTGDIGTLVIHVSVNTVCMHMGYSDSFGSYMLILAGLILGLHPANERRRCFVTTSLFTVAPFTNTV